MATAYHAKVQEMKPLSDEEARQMALELLPIIGAKCPYCHGHGKLYDMDAMKRAKEAAKSGEKLITRDVRRG